MMACDTSSTATAVDLSAEADNIMRLESEWSEMYGGRDLDGIMNLIAR